MTAQIGAYLAGTTTDKLSGLGDKFVDNLGRTWVYVQANGAITQYDFIGIDENYQAAPLTSAMLGDGWFVGAANVAFADNDYGWIAVEGANGLTGRLGASCAADAALFSTTTPGVIDDATTGTAIRGVVAVAANTTTSAGSAEVLLTFPRSATF